MDWEKIILALVLCIIKQLQGEGYIVPEPLRGEVQNLLDSTDPNKN